MKHGHTTNEDEEDEDEAPEHEETLKRWPEVKELYVFFKQQQCVKGEERSGDVRVPIAEQCGFILLYEIQPVEWDPDEFITANSN